MATIFQIKRSANVASPTTSDLAEGELAYSFDKSNDGAGAKLYIEAKDNSNTPVIHAIGGKYYTDAIDTATASNTGGKIVKRDNNGNFSANVVTATTLYGNIYGTVVGEAASAAVASTANALTTGRVINLAGDLQGNVTFDGSSDVTIYANVISDSVVLGTDTTGDYVANLSAGTGITISGYAGETSTLTVGLDSTGVSAGTYGTASSVAQVVVDAQGRITSASNVSISIPSSALNTDVALGSQTSGDYVANITAGTGIGVTNGTGETSQPTITNLGVTSLSGTANEITVSAANAAVTIGLPADVTIQNNLTVSGDLIVTGNTTTVNTATITLEDPLVKFGNANPTDVLDLGFYGEYSSSGTKYAGLFRDASDSGKFKLFVDLTTDPTTNVVNSANYTVATLVANLTGGTVTNLTSAIAVADGGTGANTLTLNGVVYGQGTSAVATATGTSGQVLQINGSGVPVFADLDGGSY